MNYFWGFNVFLKDNIEWKFTVNHVFLLLFAAAVVVVLFFLLHAKSEKGIKITKLSLASTLLFLEVSRIVWSFLYHLSLGGTAATFNWWWEFSFQMCTIMSWVTIATLYFSAFVKKGNKFANMLYHVLFGASMIGGFLAFVYPDMLSPNRPFFHFENIQTVLVHSLLIFAPIYLLKIKAYQIRLKHIWMPAMGYFYVGALSMTASQVSGKNFAFALECGLIEAAGIQIPFPWHILVVIPIVFILPLILYSAFELLYRKKHRDEFAVKTPIVTKNFILMACAYAVAVIQCLLLQLTIPLMFAAQPVMSWAALVNLLPAFALTAMFLIFDRVKRIRFGETPKLLLGEFIALCAYCLPLALFFIPHTAFKKTAVQQAGE